MLNSIQFYNSECSLSQQLYSLYIDLQSQLNHPIPSTEPKQNIISDIKKCITAFITQKINENMLQYQSTIRNIEESNRQYIQTIFYQRLQIQSLEHQIGEYIEMEEEFEEMKSKLKYDEGTFLDNDRKDNEILILRAENSNLKKNLAKIEKENEVKGERIEKLSKKIRKLELLVSNTNRPSMNSNKELMSTSSNTTHNNTKRNVLNIKQVNINNVNYNLACKPKNKKSNLLITKVYKNLLNDFSLLKDKFNDSNFNQSLTNRKSTSHSKGRSNKNLLKSPSEKHSNNIVLNILNNFTSINGKEKLTISALAKLYGAKQRSVNRSSLNIIKDKK